MPPKKVEVAVEEETRSEPEIVFVAVPVIVRVVIVVVARLAEEVAMRDEVLMPP